MPEMDGIEFLKQVRATDKTIPFILFTGRCREEIAVPEGTFRFGKEPAAK